MPPIIIKKKVSHGGHHGGAWKVAYADSVTAMMALFIVLWLMNTSKPVQEAISGYFKHPAGTAKKVGMDSRDHRDQGKRFRSRNKTWRTSRSN
jgi:chemotaxis protein MotB